MLRCVYTDLVFFYYMFSSVTLKLAQRNVYRRCHCVTDRWNGIRLGIYFFFFRSFLKEQSELFGALWAQWRMKVFNIFEIYHAFLCIIFLPFNTVNWWIIIFRIYLWQYKHTYICFFYRIRSCLPNFELLNKTENDWIR